VHLPQVSRLPAGTLEDVELLCWDCRAPSFLRTLAVSQEIGYRALLIHAESSDARGSTGTRR
jgi:hypothetical protein